MKKNKTEKRYPKHEIAKAYAPELSPKSAMRRLNRWIHHNGPLMKALKRTGYFETQKIFFKRQKRLIYKYLGSP